MHDNCIQVLLEEKKEANARDPVHYGTAVLCWQVYQECIPWALGGLVAMIFLFQSLSFVYECKLG